MKTLIPLVYRPTFTDQFGDTYASPYWAIRVFPDPDGDSYVIPLHVKNWRIADDLATKVCAYLSKYDVHPSQIEVGPAGEEISLTLPGA